MSPSRGPPAALQLLDVSGTSPEHCLNHSVSDGDEHGGCVEWRLKPRISSNYPARGRCLTSARSSACVEGGSSRLVSVVAVGEHDSATSVHRRSLAGSRDGKDRDPVEHIQVARP
jgi:hypothetical protein